MSETEVTEEVETEEPKEIEIDVSDLDIESLEENPGESEEEDVKPEKGEVEKPSWLDDDAEGEDVPLAAHIKTRKKLKGKISERDNEIENLKAEIESLKTAPQQQVIIPGSDIGPRPRIEDYDDDSKFQADLDAWEDKKFNDRVARTQAQQNQTEAARRQEENVKKEVDRHYERAGEMLKSYSIEEDAYRQADTAFREAIEAVLPRTGDVIADNMIARLGEGSEKAIFFIGRNKQRLAEFQSKFLNDNTGLQAAMHLGTVLGQLNSKSKSKPRSTAPAPAPSGGGGEQSETVNETSLKKMWKKARKSDMSKAYKIFSRAKKAGVDVSKWKG